MSEEKKITVTITEEMFAADPSFSDRGLKVGDTFEADYAGSAQEAEDKAAADAEAQAKADAEAHQAEQAREAQNNEANQNAGAAGQGQVSAPGERHPLA